MHNGNQRNSLIGGGWLRAIDSFDRTDLRNGLDDLQLPSNLSLAYCWISVGHAYPNPPVVKLTDLHSQTRDATYLVEMDPMEYVSRRENTGVEIKF